MFRRVLTISAGLAAAAMMAFSPSAQAQEFDDSISSYADFAQQYSERFQLQNDLLPDLDLTAFDALESDEAAVVEPRDQTINIIPDTATATSLPWYERFTEAPTTRINPAFGNQSDQIELSMGERWGLSFGMTERAQGPQFQLEDLSAGAFYELSERLRLGTQFRLTSPEEDIFGQPSDNEVPELKFESAFRF